MNLKGLLKSTLSVVAAAGVVLTIAGAAHAVTFTVKNNCSYTVYPGLYPAVYDNGGWSMAAVRRWPTLLWWRRALQASTAGRPLGRGVPGFRGTSSPSASSVKSPARLGDLSAEGIAAVLVAARQPPQKTRSPSSSPWTHREFSEYNTQYVTERPCPMSVKHALLALLSEGPKYGPTSERRQCHQ